MRRQVIRERLEKYIAPAFIILLPSFFYTVPLRVLLRSNQFDHSLRYYSSLWQVSVDFWSELAHSGQLTTDSVYLKHPRGL